MNLYKKGLFALLVLVIAVSCDDEYEVLQPAQNSNGPGLTEISFSSFKATSGPDTNGLEDGTYYTCLLYTSPSPRDRQKSRMPSSA